MDLSIQDGLQVSAENLRRHLTRSPLEELTKELGFII